MPCPTCSNCLTTAVWTERTLESYYRKMSGYFGHVPELKDFLDSMTRDEDSHAQTLQAALNRGAHSFKIHAQEPDLLAQLHEIMEAARRAADQPPKSFFDAYEFIFDIENEELNAIFTFLVTETMDEAGEGLGVVLAALQSHVAKANHFPLAQDPERLKRIRPLP